MTARQSYRRKIAEKHHYVAIVAAIRSIQVINIVSIQIQGVTDAFLALGALLGQQADFEKSFRRALAEEIVAAK